MEITDRQKEVLVGIAQGKDNLDIARSLGISHQTTRHHIMHLFAIFGAQNRTQLALMAFFDELPTEATAKIIIDRALRRRRARASVRKPNLIKEGPLD